MKKRNIFLALLALSCIAAVALKGFVFSDKKNAAKTKGPATFTNDDEFQPLKKATKYLQQHGIPIDKKCPNHRCGNEDIGKTVRIPLELCKQRGVETAFQIHGYEVAIGEFRRFLDATGQLDGFIDRVRTFGYCQDPRILSALDRKQDTPEIWDKLPMACVTYYEAKAYCAWKNMRLCTEKEWELACKGTNAKNLYGYGERYDSKRCRTKFYSRYACAICAHDQCVNDLGVFNMVGNVYEWVDYLSKPGEFSSVFGLQKGGDFNNEDKSNCEVRYFHDPNYSSESYGFRCCQSVQ